MPNIKQSLENIAEYIGGKVADRESIFRVRTIPEASANNLNEIIQYLGPTTEYYIRGYFYKCTYEDDQYIWLRHDVQSRAGGGEIVVSVPNISVGTYTYNEELQGPSFLGLDPGRCTITDQKKINAGQYTMSIALNDITNMKWADGSTSPKTCSYEIEKINQIISTTETSIVLGPKNPTYIIDITGSHGHLTAVSSDTSIVSIESDDNTVTFTFLGKAGSAEITITADESTNYFQSNSITLSLIATAPPELVSWSSGAIDKIEAMINGYYAGELSLDDIKSVWHVGDSRTINLSAMPATGVAETHAAQSVQMVILDFNVNSLVIPINGKTNALVSLGTKNCLNEKGVYDSAVSYDNLAWQPSQRQTWCNNVVYNAIVDSTFKSLIKQINHYVWNYNDIKYSTGSNKKATLNTDKIFFPSEKAYTGSDVGTSSDIQYEYYKTQSNRIKTVNGITSNYFNGSTTEFGNVRLINASGNGSQTGYMGYKSAQNGLAFAMCM